MRWVGYIVCKKQMRNTYKSFVGKPEKKEPLGRYRHSWEIGMDLKEIGGGLDSSGSG
jgi:hypothetical protein